MIHFCKFFLKSGNFMNHNPGRMLKYRDNARFGSNAVLTRSLISGCLTVGVWEGIYGSAEDFIRFFHAA